MSFDECIDVCAPFGFRQLIELIILRRARSSSPDSDPFIAALEWTLSYKAEQADIGRI